MRRLFLFLLILSVLFLSGCGKETAPAADALPTAAPAPTPEITPEPTPEPEPPGSGYVSVHMMPAQGQVGTHAVTAMVPVVSVTNRDAAAAAINDALQTLQMPAEKYLAPAAADGDIRRTAEVTRSDSSVLSLRFLNQHNGGVYAEGACFDTRTGETIPFSSLSEDEEALRALCRELCPEAVIEDGLWYLTDSGLALCGGAEAEIPYTALFHLLKESWMPPEREPVSGHLEAAYTAETDMDALELLDEVSVAGGLESVAIRAEGSVRDVHIAAVSFSDAAGFTVENSLWHGSVLPDGHALRLNVTVSEGIPNLMVSWDTDEGSHTAYLARNGETGQVYLANAAGGEINSDSPWAHITAEALPGYWSNDKTGAEAQSVSFAGADVCYLWHSGLGYEGDGFLWTLERREEQSLCPRVIITTPSGQLIYEILQLDGDTMKTDAGTFTRAEAVG